MDLIFNRTFVAMYVLKTLRILFIWLAVYFASQIMQGWYVNKVFANNDEPPDLKLFVLLFWAIEIAFVMCLLIILYLIKYIFDSQGDFIINSTLLGKFVTDYIFTSIITVLIGLILSSIIMKKKYFRYKTDGLRAIRSMQDLQFYSAIVITAIPFFLML